MGLGCGNSIANGGIPAASGCSMACKGNTTEYCGGSNRLNVYRFNTVSTTSSTSQSSTTQSTSTQPSSIESSFTESSTTQSTPQTSSSSTTATSSSITSSSSSSAATGSATGLPSGWEYKGCYVDNANGRVIANAQPASQLNTVARCVNACQTAGYVVAGMEFGRSVNDLFFVGMEQADK